MYRMQKEGKVQTARLVNKRMKKLQVENVRQRATTQQGVKERKG